jgi:hypothetical protein
MWILTLITLVNGGSSPSKFEEQYFHSRAECIAYAQKHETVVTYGYCSWRGR